MSKRETEARLILVAVETLLARIFELEVSVLKALEEEKVTTAIEAQKSTSRMPFIESCRIKISRAR